jgi:hypothetical protein
MTAQIISGTQVAADIRAELKARVANARRKALHRHWLWCWWGRTPLPFPM